MSCKPTRLSGAGLQLRPKCASMSLVFLRRREVFDVTDFVSEFKDKLYGPDWRGRAELCLCALAASFLLLLLGIELCTIMKIDVWRFDAVYYFDNYFHYKFRTEGRWIVCLLFPLLQHTPAHLSILLHLACLWFFGYCCCRYFTEDRAYAAVFGLALLQIHPYFSIFGWPTTSLPTVLCLALLAVREFTRLPLPWFFILGGVLFHGGFNNFYDLLPLLFLRDVCDNDWKYSLKLFCWWIAGYAVGFAAADAIVYIGAHDFIEIAPWRDPRPVRSFADFVCNAGKMAGYFRDHVEIFLSRGATVFALAAGLGISLYGWRRRRPELLKLCLVLGAVILSVYVQTLPIGIKISFRTSFPLYIGALSIFILAGRTRAKGAAAVLLCVLAFGLFQDDVRTVDFYYKMTAAFKNEFVKVCGQPGKLSGLRFVATNEDMLACQRIIMNREHLENKLTEGFGSAMRWCPVAQTCGVRDVSYVAAKPELPPRGADSMYVYKTIVDYMVMGVNPEYLKAHALPAK